MLWKVCQVQNPLTFTTMDRSELQAIIRFARKNNVMDRPFLMVYKWYNIAYSLAYQEYNGGMLL